MRALFNPTYALLSHLGRCQNTETVHNTATPRHSTPRHQIPTQNRVPDSPAGTHTETAKDLTQDTFLKASQAISAFKGYAAFYSWLFSIAQNVCIDFFSADKPHAPKPSAHMFMTTLFTTQTSTPVPQSPSFKRNSSPYYARHSNTCPPCGKKCLRCATQKNSR